MSKVGGYKIIDLENKLFTPDVGIVYDGIYEKIKQTRKPILLSGLNIEGEVVYHDFYVVPEPWEGRFVMTTHEFTSGAAEYTIEVAENDEVMISKR